ncbi:hypothetical protein [Phytohabitans houttuyneae]|jgi:hypothetical protein|uniref:Lipoprotein n=1 Tax=Phytohabitans houttuyneae TaxID=1076126 RepID=A0A6V8K277_9ACTN|nr:hypothetical protein [Phytohabitans houttuyneae]GFJ77804.1 hypothetical protein Phou_019840 [Phytohabitans houttuyneae]
MRWTSGVLLGVAVLAFATGCNGPQGDNAGPPGGTSGTSAPAPVEGTPVPNGPNVQEALDVANKQFTLLAEGNWASAWGQWTEAAKKEVPQKAFEAVNKACPVQKGQKIELQDVRPVSMELVELTWRQGEKVGHSSLRLTGGKWLYEPAGDTLVEYAGGADAAIAKRKSSNQCPSA